MIRDLLIETACLVFILAACLAPLGLYKTETGFGFYWPGVGGYHIETGVE